MDYYKGNIDKWERQGRAVRSANIDAQYSRCYLLLDLYIMPNSLTDPSLNKRIREY